MNKLTAERDWSAMEINHLLLSLPLQQSTRTLTYFELLTKALRGNEQYEDFCRVKLTLHHPHRDPQELKEVDGALSTPSLGHTTIALLSTTFIQTTTTGTSLLQSKRNSRKNRVTRKMLRLRPYIGKYPDLAILGHDYWKELKASHPLGNNQDDVPDGLFDQLNVEQRTVFDLFTRHLEKALDPQQPNPAPLLVQVDGEGGTGPTDIANLQSKLRNLRYLIIDEKSMIGLRTFGYIDSRLRQIFPEYQDTFFGGHWELLCTRVQANLTLAEVTCFDGAVRIYTTNAQVRATNLPICIGARVMLTENVWTDVSLVNGALGTIYDFAYEDHVQDPQAHHPFVIMPIFRSWRDFIKGSMPALALSFP
ncbi:uncharacterized protein HRG_08635 [Hirsutella rhossiliensis]|uniref:Uncharacterized protein n=1 Tax=Hirsutella rhossiliensis TaxID=111463 RepID=A0A9P8MSM2_9HYPO|nr:uncharacterized protein HRG_08635 [Hirsutella rhossiliensis]KAH0960480.1 hypothetical protein HRG_08635 [Hirsutella rhossiliensis]